MTPTKVELRDFGNLIDYQKKGATPSRHGARNVAPFLQLVRF